MTDLETTESRGAGAIIGSSLGLLLLFVLLMIALQDRSKEVVLADILGDLVSVDPALHAMEPLHFEKLADGRLVVLFGDVKDLPAVAEMGKNLHDGMEGMEGSHGGRRGRGGMGMGMGMGGGEPDPNSPWLKLQDGEAGQAPWQGALVHYPSKDQAEKILAREFGHLSFKDLSTISKKGGSAVVDSGHTIWNGFRVPYVRTRHFRVVEEKHVFHDSLRINLTIRNHALVLYLRWHPGHKADVSLARPFLDSWRPIATQA
ncbi:MAG: hypothetical protein JKY61_05125 [Planctomycetes bacterium]|nr:hypothetical protein [Planctomycetota bacterium]